jgi:hypothetical protein
VCAGSRRVSGLGERGTSGLVRRGGNNGLVVIVDDGSDRRGRAVGGVVIGVGRDRVVGQDDGNDGSGLSGEKESRWVRGRR